MLKALVCVSCIFLLLLYFGEKSIVNCNLGAAGGGFSLGFHGSDLLGSHIAERQGDKETRGSRLWRRPTEAPATPPHRDKSGPPGLSAWQTWGPIELIGSEQRGANSRDASTQHHCHGLLFILIVTDYSLLCPLYRVMNEQS